MRVFVTGASGFVGSVVVRELVQAGHQVLGLARSDASAKSIMAAGAKVHLGSLEDLESLRRGAGAADAVIHTAFIHDFSKFKENCEIDRRAIEAIGDVLVGTNRPLIVTSGTGLLAPGRVSTEEMQPSPHPGVPRVSEQTAAAVKARGVPVSVVRLPPTVHGEGDHGFVPRLITLAREKGIAAYVGEGLNRWPAVHRFDAGLLYRLILEKAPQGGTFHAVAEEGIAFRKISEVIGKNLKVPVVSKSPAEAADHFGWFTTFASMDAPSSSQRTQELLGWKPKQPGLLADLEGARYFQS